MLILAVIYSELGRMEEARAEVAEVLRLSPNLSLEVEAEDSLTKIQWKLERYLPPCARRGSNELRIKNEELRMRKRS